jgi:lipopolysaccharide biosynthesis protein
MIRRLALYAHHDHAAVVRPFVLHHLRKLREDCDDVVFVSTAPLPPAEVARVEPYARDVLLKENVGYDFGMWQAALRRHDVAAYDELVLSNSSTFGPVWSMRRIFAEMSARECDVWGMSDNVDIAWHLQSYFLVFKRSAFSAPIFSAFWDSVLPYRSKRQVIRSYEVGLSALFQDHGFRLAPVVSIRDLPRLRWRDRLRRRPRTISPPAAYPLELLEAGVPLLKIETFRDNPVNVDLRPVRRAVERHGYDMSLVTYDRPRSPAAVARDLR